MKYKPDWPEAQRRLSALWYGERLDRPCIAVTAPREDDDALAPSEPVDLEARWLDPEYRVPLARRQLLTTWWGGEAIPSYLQMAGWMVCLGGVPCFDAGTIWFQTRTVDYSQPSPFRHDHNSAWMQKYRALLLALCREAGQGDFLIGAPLVLPANDLLSMHLGPEQFLLALMDDPQWCADAILAGANDQLQAIQNLQELVRRQGHQYWYGNAGWMPFWAPEPFIATQCDVSCMLDPELFDRFVVPELDVYGHAHGSLWYHLDGGDARQHLPRLLSLPYLRVLQYTPAPWEPPNGPEHLEMYQRIQQAGKILHIAVPFENVEPLVRALDPALLMLETWVPSREQGERLLKGCVGWARSAPSLRG